MCDSWIKNKEANNMSEINTFSLAGTDWVGSGDAGEGRWPRPWRRSSGCIRGRRPAQDRAFIAELASPSRMATTVKPCAAIRVRIMSCERWLWPRWKQ